MPILFFLVSMNLFATQMLLGPNLSFEYNETNWEVAPPSPAAASQSDLDKEMAQKTLGSLQSKTVEDKYRARFSVVQDTLNPKKKLNDLATYRTHAVGFLKSQRFSILSEKPIKLKNMNQDGIEIEAHQRDFGLTFRQVIIVKGSSVFLLTGTSRTKSFPTYNKDFQQFLDSFKG